MRFDGLISVVQDGYLLCLQRIPSKKGEPRAAPGETTGKPVVYMHHGQTTFFDKRILGSPITSSLTGLLMCSDVWVCLTDEERCIPFVLVEQGYDVWVSAPISVYY